MSAVNVPDVSPLTVTLSCGNGTRLVQFAAVDAFPVVFPDHVCGAAVVNVIPVLPWQSPKLVAPDAAVVQVAAPAAVMSAKSITPVQTSVVAVSVTATPSVPVEFTSSRLIALFELSVSVVAVIPRLENAKLSVFDAVPVRVNAVIDPEFPAMKAPDPLAITLCQF
jgi:hypothetical protein